MVSWSSRKKKKRHFLYCLFCLKERKTNSEGIFWNNFWRKFFNIYVLSQCIVYWIQFHNIHNLHIKKHYFIHFFCLFLKLSKTLSVSLSAKRLRISYYLIYIMIHATLYKMKYNKNLICTTKKNIKLQSVTKYQRLTLVFMWNRALRETFYCYFLGLFC